LQFERLREELDTLGYTQGENVTFEYRFAAPADFGQLPALAAELVSLNVDLIVAGGAAPALAAQRTSPTIPIVMYAVSNPVDAGLVTSLAHPGANITGLAGLVIELGPKCLELLKNAFPRLARPGFLWTSVTTGAFRQVEHMQTAAQNLAVALLPMDVRDLPEIQRAVTTLTDQGADGIVVDRHSLFASNREQLVAAVAQAGLPAIYAQRELVDAGGLMGYAVNQSDDGRRVAAYVDKILRGARPADLPVEQQKKEQK